MSTAVAARPLVDPALVEGLTELRRQQKLAIKGQMRVMSPALALLRRALGWQWDMEKKERDKISRAAKSLLHKIDKGKELSEAEAAVADAVANMVGTCLDARKPFDAFRLKTEKAMVVAFEQLPIADWIKSIRGLGFLGSAEIIAETGDLSGYANPAKVWKRMGLAVIDGRRQGAPHKPATAGDWTEHGYCKQRRATVYVVSEALLKGNKGYYKKVYDAEKAKQKTLHPEPVDDPDGPWKKKYTPIHLHKIALRFMAKRLLLNLWRVWNGLPPV